MTGDLTAEVVTCSCGQPAKLGHHKVSGQPMCSRCGGQCPYCYGVFRREELGTYTAPGPHRVDCAKGPDPEPVGGYEI